MDIKTLEASRSPYQIMRSSEESHIITDTLTMQIKTFTRIKGFGTEDTFVHVTFFEHKHEITHGTAYELLKAKYFDESKVQY